MDASQLPPLHTSHYPNKELEKQTSHSRVYTLSTARDGLRPETKSSLCPSGHLALTLSFVDYCHNPLSAFQIFHLFVFRGVLVNI